MVTELPANEGLRIAMSWKNKRCPYFYPELVKLCVFMEGQFYPLSPALHIGK